MDDCQLFSESHLALLLQNFDFETITLEQMLNPL